MDEEAVEEFAKALVQRVRDPLIKALDRRFINQGVPGRHWRRVAETLPPREAILALMPDIVDETIGQVLSAVEEGTLPLFYRSSSGEMWDLFAEGGGEFTGLYASAEWVAQYSSQRYTDYGDPALPLDEPPAPGGPRP